MKILNVEQIREIDQQTIKTHNITSHDLMESAAIQLFHHIHSRYAYHCRFSIVCGNGNNGGDGLALARLLWQQGYSIRVFLCAFSANYSDDNLYNQALLHKLGIPLHNLYQASAFYSQPGEIIIDAVFGSGLNRPLDGEYAKLVNNINQTNNHVLAIDLPSGLFSDKPQSANSHIICAETTLAFQIPKWSLFLAQNEKYIGAWHLLDIGLDKHAIAQAKTRDTLLTSELVSSLYKPRKRFAHKGNHGHSLIIAGSYGKLGALTLCARACLRTGSGLTTCYAPKSAFISLQSNTPSAMFISDENENHISDIPDITPYDSIAIGPGLGTHQESMKAVAMLLSQARATRKKILLDADALNIMAQQPNLLDQLHPDCIITPHPKEFARLAGDSQDNYATIHKLREFSARCNCIVVLKGKHTLIANPDGNIFVNNTGNAGLAKGGSGDTLSGIITAFLAQGYSSIESAILGVYLHGLAADIAVKEIAMESLIADDLSEYLSAAFKQIAA